MLTTGLWILGFHLDISRLEHLGQILSSSSLLKLREKCPNREYFLVRIFPHSEYLSVFSPNAGKYGPEKFGHFGHFSRMCNFVII